MISLTAANLPSHGRAYSYEKDQVDVGIVHFGIGNFHRAHQAVYVEDLLEAGDLQWGIVGVSLRSDGMKRALKPQDYNYTLAILGEQTTYRVIGAIKDIIVAPQQPQILIDLIANPKTQLITSTITEKGYYLFSGQVDMAHPLLESEMQSLKDPATIYGFLASGLLARFISAPNSKLTIMCCDNISGGGELLEQGVRHLLSQHHEEALAWSKKNVSFISSMVDRVSPATDDKLRKAVLSGTGRADASPVSAEPFTQWIIEDNFAGDRPAFDKVGAVFVKDIAPFERMKLSYLNAAHTIASTLGYLCETQYVHEALQKPDVLNFTWRALYENVFPNSAVPSGYDGAVYIEDVIKRFQNGNLPYANLQVGTDSSQKIQQRWFPALDAALSKGNNTSYFAFALGAWICFIDAALAKGVLNDPKKGEFEKVSEQGIAAHAQRYLQIANAEKFDFFGQPDFIESIIESVENIRTHGVDVALRSFLALKNPA